MNAQFTDTQRLNFIEKHKIEPRFSDFHQYWILGTYISNGQYHHWARNADLRMAIDEAMKLERNIDIENKLVEKLNEN